ncbi:Holliday junction DNA helicase subunit RuvA [Thermosporothrix hazakensis]|jgi:Holliday junction DNA helicase RuvA|uniref:Holliday junction branch migration complex subunit RuvA n=2 Tax=Thermosporothrix TaxID=768650 RepID=A0A326UPV3_THEHA|nr:Holliday junction branch migration protein RuvA [Thermosporothrix hazakensis]PZW36199.1 Holliday junction DNA helicase subunit RuvA [Thermosporothrix hazakensis]BBH88663.1 Holliday junction ATP-dependent DNA helicase RuvA [Thermosporothrix sp. COM3]GCE46849.1 Holliday junction ATP-dependent DNA helicase RuvA [Thermosporothrix hazakensis]
MITSIHGILEACRADSAIIRVGGFGIQVFAPATTLSHLTEPGTEVHLHTHFHMREDGITLYGFDTEADRDAFTQLITVNGVGPRVALAILSVMDAATLYKAIADEDVQRLGLARGVGKRLASQLILALKGKLPTLPAAEGTAAGPTANRVQAEVLEALIGLGFSNAEAQAAIARIPQDQPMTLEEQVTYALRTFSRQ